jgi:hypothetical protein
MNKHLSFLSVATLLLIASCREKGSLIDFAATRAVDTTYLLQSTEAPEQKRIMIEEATGVVCSNCPAATEVLKSAEAAHPDRLIIVGLHAGLFTEPAEASRYDFRNETVMDVYTLLNSGDPDKPSAALDRIPQSKGYFEDRNKWPGIINQRLQTKSPLNVSLTSSFNPETREDTIRIRISYTEPVGKAQRIGIVITEDGIVDYQLNGLKKDTFYTHNHVLRDFVTPVNGHSFLDTLVTKEAGRVYERTYVFKLPERAFGEERTRWNIDNCNVIGFVFNNEPGDIDVVQSVEIKLKK